MICGFQGHPAPVYRINLRVIFKVLDLWLERWHEYLFRQRKVMLFVTVTDTNCSIVYQMLGYPKRRKIHLFWFPFRKQWIYVGWKLWLENNSYTLKWGSDLVYMFSLSFSLLLWMLRMWSWIGSDFWRAEITQRRELAPYNHSSEGPITFAFQMRLLCYLAQAENLANLVP